MLSTPSFLPGLVQSQEFRSATIDLLADAVTSRTLRYSARSMLEEGIDPNIVFRRTPVFAQNGNLWLQSLSAIRTYERYSLTGLRDASVSLPAGRILLQASDSSLVALRYAKDSTDSALEVYRPGKPTQRPRGVTATVGECGSSTTY